MFVGLRNCDYLYLKNARTYSIINVTSTLVGAIKVECQKKTLEVHVLPYIKLSVPRNEIIKGDIVFKSHLNINFR